MIIYVDEIFVSRCLADGVLNSEDYVRGPVWNKRGGIIDIDISTLPILKRIIDETAATIVVSSSWRKIKKDLQLLWETLENYNIRRSDYVTPVSPSAERGEEILTWLEDHKELHVTNYAILDDDYWDLNTPEIASHFFQTTWEHGLTNEIADKVIEYLNGEETL